GTALSAAAMATRARAFPLQAIVYTDIRRDGMLSGPDLQGLRAVAKASGLPVIASGGIACAEDLRRLRSLEGEGVAGAIVGKALYDGRLSLEEALQAGAG
ncbi:MAG TPA: HisA/HisF-related TIM barrel protein, partial [Candidatus Sulfotelmatobacter sp.]|nr:HisA/HisF-related TIM barrel protein [Candidatus Sulfotelmatobacter sp.]